MTTVLTIAGSDPSGGAGIQADLRTINSFGVKGLSAITAITAQSETTVFGVYPIPPDILTHQLSAAAKTAKIDAVKIGMIGNSANVNAIILFLHSIKPEHVVIDPVFVSTSGMPLLETHAMKLFKEGLLPLATVITPNLNEAGILTGMRLWNLGTMKEAARQIHAETFQLRQDRSRPLAVLVKGGHLSSDPIDILFDGKDFTEFSGKRIEGNGRHGTGCVLSSAIAAYLADGKDVHASISEAKQFVEDYIRSAVPTT